MSPSRLRSPEPRGCTHASDSVSISEQSDGPDGAERFSSGCSPRSFFFRHKVIHWSAPTAGAAVISNYFAATLRNLAHHRLYAVVTMVALGIGLTASLLICLYIRDELRFDHWIQGHEEVYRVAMGLELNGIRIAPSAGAAAPVAQWLQADYPEIAVTARMRASQRRVRHDSIESLETVYWADPSIFDVLPLPLVAGQARNALNAPDAVVVTRRVARKYFHTDDPVGQVLLIDGSHVFRIAAVLPGRRWWRC
jgi:putative ABC transport system permease protein